MTKKPSERVEGDRYQEFNEQGETITMEVVERKETEDGLIMIRSVSVVV